VVALASSHVHYFDIVIVSQRVVEVSTAKNGHDAANLLFTVGAVSDERGGERKTHRGILARNKIEGGTLRSQQLMRGISGRVGYNGKGPPTILSGTLTSNCVSHSMHQIYWFGM